MAQGGRMDRPDADDRTSLTKREFSDDQIRRRLKAAATPGFGLDGATPEQLQLVYLLSIHYDVDPITDLTLFRDRPFFTIDGRVRLMRRHPQYRGYTTRPLSGAEKEAWGYKPEEIVVECTIRTAEWGEITARGKVDPSEFSRQPVARSYPQEMAEKRAIARTSRLAFGQAVPNEDDVLGVIEERDNPELIAANAKKYAEIFTESDEDT
jgi:hypothetical protein